MDNTNTEINEVDTPLGYFSCNFFTNKMEYEGNGHCNETYGSISYDEWIELLNKLNKMTEYWKTKREKKD